MLRFENENLKAFGWDGLSNEEMEDRDELQKMLDKRERRLTMKRRSTQANMVQWESLDATGLL